jgi:hypothetical protein
MLRSADYAARFRAGLEVLQRTYGEDTTTPHDAVAEDAYWAMQFALDDDPGDPAGANAEGARVLHDAYGPEGPGNVPLEAIAKKMFKAMTP